MAFADPITRYCGTCRSQSLQNGPIAAARQDHLEQQEEESHVFFATVDKFIAAASALSRRGRVQRAAKLLRQAHGFASEKSAAGFLEGGVATASIGVQYSALLSKDGQHEQALQEAAFAAQDSDKVWGDLLVANAAAQLDNFSRRSALPHYSQSALDAVLENPPRWIERAVIVHVQAKHCLALEMEFQTRWTVFGDEGSWQDLLEKSASLHREACLLSQQLLPPGHPTRLLSERVCQQANGRQDDPALAKVFRRRPASAPCGKAKVSNTVKPPFVVSAFPPQREMLVLRATADDGIPERVSGGKGRCASAPTRMLSWSITCEDSEAADRGGSASQQRANSNLQQFAASTRDKFAGKSCLRSLVPEGGSESDSRANKRRNALKDVGVTDFQLCESDTVQDSNAADRRHDIFSEWLMGNVPASRKSKLQAKLSSEDGVRLLKTELQEKSRYFRVGDLPRFSPEEMFESRTRYSDYGRQVQESSEKRFAKYGGGTYKVKRPVSAVLRQRVGTRIYTSQQAVDMARLKKNLTDSERKVEQASGAHLERRAKAAQLQVD